MPAVYYVTLPPSAAASMWITGVDGVAGVDGVKLHDRYIYVMFMSNFAATVVCQLF